MGLFITPIPNGAPANADTFNDPLGQADAAIAGLKDGDIHFEQISLSIGDTLEIVSGVVTIEHSWHKVDTEGGASSDNLDTIDGEIEGDILLLQIVSGARPVTVRHNVGNIYLNKQANIVLDDQRDVLMLFFDGTRWSEMGAGDWLSYLGVGTSTNLTIAAGAITATKSLHVIDTQGGAATDELNTINGGTEGYILFLRSASNARVITIEHDVDNIYTRNGNSIVLNDPNHVVAFFYTNGQWNELATEGALVAKSSLDAGYAPVRYLNYPKGVFRETADGSVGEYDAVVMPSPEVRDSIRIKAYNGDFISGDAVIATLGESIDRVNVNAGHFCQLNTDANINDAASVATDAFNCLRIRWDPLFAGIVRLDGTTDNRRMWIGIFESMPGNTDNIGGAGVEGVGFRYSTNASDATWKGVCSNGVTQTVVDTGVSVAGATKYTLKFWVDNTNDTAWFSVNDSDPVSISTNLPADSTDLGIAAKVITLEATAHGLGVSRLYVEHD